jgi:hypothetical protein
MRKKKLPKGAGHKQTLRIGERNRRERRINLGTVPHLFGPAYRGDLPDFGTSQGAVQWSTGRSSLSFCGLRRMVQWGREVDSRK